MNNQVEQVSRMEAVSVILDSPGRIFTVVFTKRTTGEERTMTCRTGVQRHLRGGQAAYDFFEKRLLSVWDMQAEGYRSVPVEGIREVRINGRHLRVVGGDVVITD